MHKHAIERGGVSMTIYSEETKLNKMKWLADEGLLNELSPLQIQKFLFYSEMFNRETGEEYSLKKLRAYKNGPVYSDVYGDVTYRKSELLEEIKPIVLPFNDNELNNLKKAAFITMTHNDNELSSLTHRLDLWKSKEQRINANEQNISIYEHDITESDSEALKKLYNYAQDLNEYKVISIGDKVFLFNAEDEYELKGEMLQTLELLSNDDSLVNPVYVDIEDGVMVID